MPRNLKNVAESVKDRLLAYASKNNRRFDSLLTAFGHERLIYRLSTSNYRGNYVLKGGMLVMQWTGAAGRSTADVDFGTTIQQTREKVITEFKEILAIEFNDGIVYDPEKFIVQPIGRVDVFEGIRLKTTAYLNKTRIAIKIDIGMSDKISHKLHPFEYSSLLDFPSANVLAYSPAYVLAEKFQAIIDFELLNSRLKDYFDLYTLRREIEVSPAEMSEAITDTFGGRGTQIPTTRPPGLSAEFSNDKDKQWRWSEYSRQTKYSGISLQMVADDIWEWLEPICKSATKSN